ncbi:MAG: phosphate ABC transporter ATP-binding protein [Armatimonadetes bacterium CG2_30_59_28]|nr:phosphate ABC transporter ATP-binding protein [Armatimonadota bacterium]OIO96989.1 MAG: phosphate ABC transporter ATP-binding protein [Armatimonadetes bacterium CG2_30_59_28]PIU64226.1 MAG: phosphate ABC transporter ATP-binding protein [Armatimonadetes bacterium CG07_land_8_20_14_0_80_59_28]PIX44295.1 MAG: phosphate ABC transporter ATP-binding protein [Armatimonadetes bacterium CG_4_8_14_3_um_filter_58_9]PIY49020.1 MAG: phosphate ABC transporter ATP-binding protein [Armatimonadetes bacterium
MVDERRTHTDYKFVIRDLTLFYGEKRILNSLDLSVRRNEILGIIGPANSGKSTFLRTLNRMIDLTPLVRAEGEALLDGVNVLGNVDVHFLRRRVGIVFALPLPLPLSIFDNVAYGPRRHRSVQRGELPDLVERSLQAAFLWDEVKDRLHEPAMNLSGGQQQRLCIARTLAVQPEVILFDEPCSGLDPISTARVEDAMRVLKEQYTLILVTNLVAQASRVSDRTAFFLSGDLVEVDETEQMFRKPSDQRTDDYIAGRFG